MTTQAESLRAALLERIRNETREAVIEGDANDCSSADCIADAVYEIVRLALTPPAEGLDGFTGPDCGIDGCAREVGHIGDHRLDPTGPMQRSGVLGKYLNADQLKANAELIGGLREHLQTAHGCDGPDEKGGHWVATPPADTALDET